MTNPFFLIKIPKVSVCVKICVKGFLFFWPSCEGWVWQHLLKTKVSSIDLFQLTCLVSDILSNEHTLLYLYWGIFERYLTKRQTRSNAVPVKHIQRFLLTHAACNTSLLATWKIWGSIHSPFSSVLVFTNSRFKYPALNLLNFVHCVEM